MKTLIQFSILKLLIVFIFIFLMGSQFIPHVFAQNLPKQYLSISPIVQDIQLIPGKPHTFELTIQNRAETPIGIHIDPSSFDPDNLASTTGTERRLTSWMNLSENNFIISEKESKKVIVIISPPKKTGNGGYYGTLIITPFISGQQQFESPIILTRFVAVIFGTVGKIDYENLSSKIEISDFKVDKIFLKNNTLPHLFFGVKNNYFTHFTAKPFITISPLFASPVKLTPEEKHVFPGKIREWNKELQIPLDRIIYKADLAVSVGNGKQILESIFFILIPLQITFYILIFAVFIVLFLIRQRLIKAFSILVGKKEIKKKLDKKKKI